MHAEVINIEVRNPDTHLWEYFEDDNYNSGSNPSDIQSKINWKLKICHCALFECCGSYFHELFTAIETTITKFSTCENEKAVPDNQILNTFSEENKNNRPSLFKGVPKDVSEKIACNHTIWFEDIEMGYDASYLYLQDIMEFDYNQTIEKKSGWEEISGVHCTKSWSRVLKSGYETEPTYRKVLGEKFFIDLDFVKTIGKPEEVRIVYWFWDNSNNDPNMDDILNHWTC